MVATVALITLLIVAFGQLGGVARRNCQEIEVVKTRIRVVVRSSLTTLGKPGTAGYGYYLTHPTELEQARQALREELVQFAPDRC